MKFEDFLSAGRHAHAEKERAEGQAGESPLDEKKLRPAPGVVDYFINLQTKTWRGGPADYRAYAKEVWKTCVPRGHDKKQEDVFQKFEGAMIRNLHNVDMQQHVYPDVVPTMRELLRTYGSEVRRVVLWSTGDVSATGHQVAKIERSGIIRDFYQSLRSENEKDDAKRFMSEKTAYLVDDDKFERLKEYVEAEARNQTEGPIKIVILEDSDSNFDKADSVLDTLDPALAARVEIVPIWALYSRHARRSESGDGGKGDERTMKREELNAIRRFSDLSDAERFGPILKDAHFFIDFDGVITNDDTRRVDQVEAVIQALLESGAVGDYNVLMQRLEMPAAGSP